MKAEELVLSVEQAKHLQELGLNMDDAAFWWVKYINGEWRLSNQPIDILLIESIIPTYTLQEVLNKLPKNINEELFLNVSPVDTIVRYISRYGAGEWDYIEQGKNLLEAAYNMLCWVIENGYY